MSQVLYEASPSLVRMNPFGSVLLILALVGGVILATPPVASGLSANLALDSRFVSLADWPSRAWPSYGCWSGS